MNWAGLDCIGVFGYAAHGLSGFGLVLLILLWQQHSHPHCLGASAMGVRLQRFACTL
jgi:hypothetical protein